MEQNNPSKQDIDLQKSLAKRILVGAVAADVLAVIYFCFVTYAENNSDTKVPSLIAAVYLSMGKIGGTTLFLGLGMILVIVYVIKMARIKKMK